MRSVFPLHTLILCTLLWSTAQWMCKNKEHTTDIQREREPVECILIRFFPSAAAAVVVPLCIDICWLRVLCVDIYENDIIFSLAAYALYAFNRSEWKTTTTATIKKCQTRKEAKKKRVLIILSLATNTATHCYTIVVCVSVWFVCLFPFGLLHSSFTT